MHEATPTPRPVRTGRRRLLTLGALGSLTALGATGALSGCTVRDESADDGSPSPDEAALERVVASTRALRDLADEVAATRLPRARKVRATALVTCLDDHLRHLSPATSTPAPAAPGSTAPTPASTAPVASTFAGLLDEAQRHVVLLTDTAGEADSGTFARLLACAGAGLSQILDGDA